MNNASPQTSTTLASPRPSLRPIFRTCRLAPSWDCSNALRAGAEPMAKRWSSMPSCVQARACSSLAEYHLANSSRSASLPLPQSRHNCQAMAASRTLVETGLAFNALTLARRTAPRSTGGCLAPDTDAPGGPTPRDVQRFHRGSGLPGGYRERPRGPCSKACPAGGRWFSGLRGSAAALPVKAARPRNQHQFVQISLFQRGAAEVVEQQPFGDGHQKSTGLARLIQLIPAQQPHEGVLAQVFSSLRTSHIALEPT